MKKISVAVLAAAMLAGTVTAADVSFSYKGSNYFGPNGSNTAYLGRTDCMSVSLIGDVGGVVVDFDSRGVKGNDGYKEVVYDKPSNDRGNVGLGFVRDEYYGWMSFALPLGSLQVTAGRWSGRNLNRVLTDRGDLEEKDFELFKPGIINGVFGKDSANLTNGKLGMVAAWTLADVLPGTLMAKVGLAQYSDDDDIGDWQPDADKWHVEAGFAGEVSYWQEDSFRATLAVRSLNRNSYSFGAWISPVVGDALQMTLGGTIATGKLYDGKAWSNRKNEWGVDFRLRLQVSDDLSITTMNNISSGYDAKGTEMADGRDGNVGKMWNMVNATYQFADNLTAAFTLQSITNVYCPHYNDTNWTLIMSPSLVIQASERARVTTSVRAQMNDTENWTFKNMNIVVPVIFSFNY